MTITGECFCGEMRYEISEIPEDATMCHCSRCRKAFSGSGSAYSRVKEDTFRWTAGENNLQTYVNRDGWGIGFCKKCGSTLCGINQNKVVGVTLGMLNDNPNISIKEHIFVGSKACWDEISGAALQYDGAPK